jgi:hypothetical protein
MAEGQNRGERMLSPRRDFLIRTLINRNTLSIVDHMFFFSRWELTPRVLEGSPLTVS